MNTTILLLLFAPLFGFLINTFFGKSLGKTISGVIGTAAIVVSFLGTISLFSQITVMRRSSPIIKAADSF